MSRLPTLFVSHGAPTLALEPGETGAAWTGLARSLPRPRAVVVVSAHWSAPGPRVGSGAHHATIHDFYGFPAPLYQLRYEPPGDPALAAKLVEGLGAAGYAAAEEPARGLDHGAWVPLRSMYPEADLPVVPLSLDARQGPHWHYRLGRALAPLLGEEVLLLASGSLTHNLGHFVPGDPGPAPGYVERFQDWLYQRLQAGDLEGLLDYRSRAAEARQAHPTDEHLLPLYVALGAAGEGATANRHHAEVRDRALAMDVYSFAATRPAQPAVSGLSGG